MTYIEQYLGLDLKQFLALPQALRNFSITARATHDTSILRIALTRLLVLRVLVLTIIFSTQIFSLFFGSIPEHEATSFAWPVLVIYGLSLINALLLPKFKHLVALGYIQMVTDVVLATMTIHITGSFIAILLYILIIIGAAAIFQAQGSVLMAVCAALFFLISGVLTPASGRMPLMTGQEVGTTYVIFLIVAILSGYFSSKVKYLGLLASKQERDLSSLSEQQRVMFNDISEGLITLDLDSSIININQAASAIIGLTNIETGTLLGKQLPDLFESFGAELPEKVFSEHSGSSSAELTLQRADQETPITLTYSIKQLRNEQGEPTGKLFVFRDVTREKNMEESLTLHEQMTALLATSDEDNTSSSGSCDHVQMIGESAVIKHIFSLVNRVAMSDASVLICGESGTGKELIAKAIHCRGLRAGKPFVAINCGAIPESLIESELFGHKKGSFTGAIGDNIGLFRQASGGSIFLDEVGELPTQTQSKLLRVLQERRVRPVGDVSDYAVDIRLIAATNRDLKKEVTCGHFREDLYYRLNVVNIVVPPLRDRREDIALMVRYFMGKLSGHDKALPKISPEALTLLTSYGFPGNVRELENIIERALVFGGNAILPEHLPTEVTERKHELSFKKNASNLLDTRSIEPSSKREISLPIDLEKELSTLEQRYLVRALEESGGVKKRAAELLGLNFRSMRYRLKKYSMGESL